MIAMMPDVMIEQIEETIGVALLARREPMAVAMIMMMMGRIKGSLS